MTAPGKTKRKGYPLRMPPRLHAALSEVAKKEHRTLNAQIVVILERWLEAAAGR
jgi:hypothetical protein